MRYLVFVRGAHGVSCVAAFDRLVDAEHWARERSRHTALRAYIREDFFLSDLPVEAW